MRNRILIHIPHSSMNIPKRYRPLLLLEPAELDAELLRMTDRYTDDLFDLGRPRMVFPISRLICDVERFRDEAEECMTQRGMWVCYEKTALQTPLKEVSQAHREEILRCWYDPHHAALTRRVNEMLDKESNCLLIDAHSFPSRALPYEPCQSGVRPDICIGTDDFHTPPFLTALCIDFLRGCGYRVRRNMPFSGCLIPKKRYHREKRVMGVMLELNRQLYMDETTGLKKPRYDSLKSDIDALLDLLEAQLPHMKP